MIRVDFVDVLSEQNNSDGSIRLKSGLLRQLALLNKKLESTCKIIWCYDNDSELFQLKAIIDTLRNFYSSLSVNLMIPYIPHQYNKNDYLTLKSFSDIINSMNINEVSTLDPYNPLVLTGSFDRLISTTHFCETLLSDHEKVEKEIFNGESYSIMFPTRKDVELYYYIPDSDDAITGEEYLNKDNEIYRYRVVFKKTMDYGDYIPDNVLMISNSFTTSYNKNLITRGAEFLKSKGVKKIVLAVSHCDNSILDSDAMKYIDKVITSGDICTLPESDRLSYNDNNIRKMTEDQCREVIRLMNEKDNTSEENENSDNDDDSDDSGPRIIGIGILR